MTDEVFLFIMATFILSSLSLRISIANLKENREKNLEAKKKERQEKLDELYGR